MDARLRRALFALVLAGASLATGYIAGTDAVTTPSIPAQTVTSPAAGTTRLLYSLDAKQNDQELIALINDAESHIYFAIYTFTLKNVADALVAAKERGVDVRGIVDSEQSQTKYSKPVIQGLIDAGIPVVVEKHAGGDGIMHIKALVTEKAYAIGSYNWTASATSKNDEILQIGTDPGLRGAYENILLKLLEFYKGNAALSGAASVLQGPYDFKDAAKHIGERAVVRGVLIEAHTSSSGTVFLDFCENYKTCPFSAVIFADDVAAFGDLTRYVGEEIQLKGMISSYQGRAKIKLSDPSQIES